MPEVTKSAARDPGSTPTAAVLIGRFQPYHHGHQALLERALSEAQRVVVVLGSAMQARSPKNPFTWKERAGMIRAAAGSRADRLQFLPMRDYYDDSRWVKAVTDGVHERVGRDAQISLIGHDKDATSYYLNRFSAWQLVMENRQGNVEATAIRRVLFGGSPPGAALAVLREHLPGPVHDYLQAWVELPFHKALTDAWLSIKAGREKWAGAPYPPIFVTADAVVRADGHVLLIRRAREPGAGLLALPGGFVEQDERLLQSAMRELREETRIGLLEVTLEDAFRAVKTFDHPQRSLRGRTITHAHFFDLGEHRPEVMAADDAAEVRWVPIAELGRLESELFEDHFAILDHFLDVSTQSAPVAG